MVNSLVQQLEKERIKYEIICMDDASTKTFETHTQIEKMQGVSYLTLKENIGRSRIRNKLSSQAKYDWLLFLDADTLPVHANYISNYIDTIKPSPKEQVFSGGLAYRLDDLTPTSHLRFKYGQARESLSVEKRSKEPFTTLLMSNTLLKKDVFSKVQFNDKITLYGHEDAVFSYELFEASIKVKHIDNPVYHTGLESNEVFIKKTRTAVKNLWYLYLQGLMHPEINRLLKFYTKAKQFFLVTFFSKLYAKFHSSFEKKLSNKNPSLLLFDLYRFSYLCHLSKTKK